MEARMKSYDSLLDGDVELQQEIHDLRRLVKQIMIAPDETIACWALNMFAA